MPTEQKPMLSGLGPKTTAKEALAGRDLRSRLTRPFDSV